MVSPLYSLGSDDLHVLRAYLDLPNSTAGRLRKILSPDEEARADRFHFAIDRNRFVVARARLRIILSSYLGIDPSEIRFRYGAHGKPSLANSSAAAIELNFNMSHSGVYALYAVMRGSQIGVDLEEIRAEFAEEKLPEHFFSATEVAQLRSLLASDQLQAFFNCWTRKEAFIKAKGVGLSQALDQFSVTLAPGEPALMLETKWDEAEASRWFLESIDVGPNFAAAVAFEGEARRICCRDFEERWKPFP